MTTESEWRRIEELFEWAVELPRSEREGFLDRHCGDNQELKAHLLRLLQEDDDGTKDLLKSPATNVLRPSEPEESIGRYRIQSKIAEGGMGTVYLASQESPVQRQVALKVLKLGLDGAEATARFEAERQALALMDHPGIARVFDGGATERGRPWFAMEYVEGPSLDVFIQQDHPSVDRLLDLFIDLCDAVQHAHHKGVIHRDLKPSNVLVSKRSDGASPIVIDFGIACAVNPSHDLSKATKGEIVGSIKTMSPEQFEGSDIDARADVYAIGVMLFESLCSKPPFDVETVRDSSMADWAKKRASQPPPRASDLCRTSNPERARQLTGDLDAILARALAPDRIDRYSTPTELAADLRRHRQHLPVHAVEPTPLYLVGRFARRHRLVAIGLIVGLAGLLVGSGFALWGMFEAKQQALFAHARESEARGARAQAVEALEQARLAEAEAQRESAEARALAQYLDRILSLADPEVSLGRDLSALDMLRWAARGVGQELREHPEGEAQVRRTLGQAFHALGFFAEAQTQLVQAASILEATEFASIHEHYATVRALALLDDDSGSREGVEARYRAAALGTEVVAANHPAVGGRLRGLWASVDIGDLESAFATAPSVIRLANDTIDREASKTWLVLAEVYDDLAYYIARVLGDPEGLFFFDESLRIRRSILDPKSPRYARSLNNAARALLAAGRIADAEELVREAEGTLRQTLGEDHWLTSQSRSILGECLALRGDHSVAEDVLEGAYEKLVQSLGVHAPATIDANVRLLRLLKTRGPESTYSERLEGFVGRLAISPDFPTGWYDSEELVFDSWPQLRESLFELESLLSIFEREGREAEPSRLEELIETVIAHWEGFENADRRRLILARLFASQLLYADDTAYSRLEDLIALTLEELEPRSSLLSGSLADALCAQARLLNDQGSPEESLRVIDRARTLYHSTPGDRRISLIYARFIQAQSQWELDEIAEALDGMDHVWGESVKRLGSEHLLTRYAFSMLAEMLVESDQAPRVQPYVELHLTRALAVQSEQEWVPLATKVLANESVFSEDVLALARDVLTRAEAKAGE